MSYQEVTPLLECCHLVKGFVAIHTPALSNLCPYFP